MNKPFDQFKNNDEEEEPAHSHTSEVHTHTIMHAREGNDVTLEERVEDEIGNDGRYQKSTHTTVVRADCCGALSAFSKDIATKLQAPGGRCPSCQAMLCRKHAEDRHFCSVCGKTLCVVCSRKTLAAPKFTFCRDHFNEYVHDENAQYIRDSLKADKREIR